MKQAQRAVIALFVLLVMWCAWQSRLSSQHPILPSGERQHQQGATATTTSENPTQNINWNNWTHDPIAVFTGLLTLFNGLLLASTVGLWLATRKSASISERALIDLERPYIVFHEIKTDIGLFLSPNTVIPSNFHPSFHFTVINYGRTPGNIVRAMIQFDILNGIPEEPKIEDVSLQNPGYKVAVIVIGQAMEYTFNRLRLLRIQFPQHERLGLQNGTLKLYCYGMIEYRDIFDKIHTVNFCRCFDFSQNEWVPVGEKHRNQGN